MTPLRILFVGELVRGSRTIQRVEALKRLGHDVFTISTVKSNTSYEENPSLWVRVRHRIRLPVDRGDANSSIKKVIKVQSFDIVWVDRAIELRSGTLRSVRTIHPTIRLIWYSADDMMNPIHRSR